MQLEVRKEKGRRRKFGNPFAVVSDAPNDGFRLCTARRGLEACAPKETARVREQFDRLKDVSRVYHSVRSQGRNFYHTVETLKTSSYLAQGFSTFSPYSAQRCSKERRKKREE